MNRITPYIEAARNTPGQRDARFKHARKIARHNGLELSYVGRDLYELAWPNGTWMRIRPAARVIFRGRGEKRGPKINVDEGWTIVGLVRAAIEATSNAR